MKIKLSRQIFEKYSNINFMKARSVGVELFHADRETDGRTDGRTNERTEGQTDRHDETNNVFRSFANEPKHYLLVKYLYK